LKFEAAKEGSNFPRSKSERENLACFLFLFWLIASVFSQAWGASAKWQNSAWAGLKQLPFYRFPGDLAKTRKQRYANLKTKRSLVILSTPVNPENSTPTGFEQELPSHRKARDAPLWKHRAIHRSSGWPTGASMSR